MNYSESTIRRRAYNIGYRVEKGFQHFGQFVYHDSCGDRFTGYTATFPANNAIMAAAEFDTPAGEQMAVYYNDTQISAPSTVENGVHTMTVDTSNLPESALNKEIALTVKYIESGNASGATAITNVTVTAVARVEKDSTTTYVGALADAFTEGNSGATVTLLSEVDLGSNYIGIRGSSTFTLDLNGQTVKASYYGAFDISDGSLTIQDSGTGGKIESSNITIKVTGGTLSIKSGTVSGYYGVQITRGTVNISGGVISGTENGLWVNGGGNIVLSGGAYSGRHAIWVDANVSVTLKDLLASECAYHSGDTPIPLQPNGKELTGTVTVKECSHTGEGVCTYTHNENTSTHTKTCLACGQTLGTENCTYTFSGATGTCAACRDSVTVAVSGTENLVYDGTGKEPGVTVTRGETALTAGTDYTVAYTDNKNAGENKATVAVTIGNGQGTYTENFSIGKATLYVAPNSQTIRYGESIREGASAILTRGLATGDYVVGVTLTPNTRDVPGGKIIASEVQIQNESGADVTGNYEITYVPGNLTINPVDVKLTFNDQTITYGDTPTLATADPASAEIKYSYITGERVEPISGWPTNAGTYTVTAKVEASGNYGEATATATLTISKAPLTIAGATVASKPYDTNDTATVTGVTFDGLKNGETLALGTDYTATGTFADANAGTGKSVTVTVTLANTAKANNYNLTPNTTTATADITKASSSITKAPTASGITYGQALSDSNLTDGAGSVAGAFSWTAPATKPSAGTAQYEVTFTPTDTNYDTATVNVTVTVAKATPTVTWTNAAQTLDYTGSEAAITPPTVTLVNGESFNGTISYSYAPSGSTSYTSGLPVNAGTYTVKASIGEQSNYIAAESAEMTLTISKINYIFGEKQLKMQRKRGILEGNWEKRCLERKKSRQ